jgi:hypothetical protein
MVAWAMVRVTASPLSQDAASPDTTTEATPSTKVNVVDGMVAVPAVLVSATETPVAMALLNQVWTFPAAVWSSMKTVLVQAASVAT